MKYLAYSALLLFLISCTQKQPKETLCFVNDQNDGFNAFSITLRDDNTYKREDFGSSNTGKYSISNNIISLDNDNPDSAKIIFDKTKLGCIYNARYISKGSPTDMRVVFDSLFCIPISNKKLIGNWKYENSLLETDTLQLVENGTARFRKDDYSTWDFDNGKLWLHKDDISMPLLVLNIIEDSLWFNPIGSLEKNYSIKAVRAK